MTISSGSGGLVNLHRTRSDPEAKVDCAIQSVGQASVRETMQTPRKYREGAQRCRELLDHQLEPEVRIQLRLWAAELDDIAAAIECGSETSVQKEFARPL
jgi:hypothetical protein